MGKKNQKLAIMVALVVASTFTGCSNKTAKQSESVAEVKQAGVLTAKKLAYFNKELNGKYKISGQLGKSGANSSAYLMEDTNGEKYVLKIPNSEKETSV